jgi:RNA polymerase sigma-70 factor (ECF subfamily)
VSFVYEAVTSDVTGMALAQETAVAPADAGTRLLDLFDRHHRRLYVIARRMTPGAEEARDLVQEAFLRAARAPASIPLEASASEAWMVRVLVNVCRDQWRVRAARRRLEARFPAASALPRPSDPEAALIAQTMVWSALGRLAPRRRAVIVLYELEGAGIPQIARMLGISTVTVRWHLSRGRRELAQAVRGLERGQR